VAKAKNVPVITTKRNRENSQDSDEDLTKSTSNAKVMK
jgi:hypothetical protein